MTDTEHNAEPQNPPFVFPEKISLVPCTGYLGFAVTDKTGNAIKDDAGEIIIMGYTGPTPKGKPAHGLWIVSNDTPTEIHPSSKYIYQRYRKELQ